MSIDTHTRADLLHRTYRHLAGMWAGIRDPQWDADTEFVHIYGYDTAGDWVEIGNTVLEPGQTVDSAVVGWARLTGTRLTVTGDHVAFADPDGHRRYGVPTNL